MNVLEIKNATYKYSIDTPFEVTALDDVSLDIEKGKILALIGQTGSGKSTLVQLLNALIVPTTGSVLLDGNDINESPKTQRDARFKVGLCFQYPEYQIFESTIYDDIAFGPKNMQLSTEEIDKRVREAAHFTGLSDNMLQKSPFDVSGGERRRVAIAGIIAMRPEVLVMDEPVAGLDPRGKSDVLKLISDYNRETGATVIVVSHSMDDVASIADRVAVMNNGKIVLTGSVSEVFSESELLISMGLNVPQVTGIVASLISNGFDLNPAVYTLPQAQAEILRFLEKEGVIC